MESRQRGGNAALRFPSDLELRFFRTGAGKNAPCKG